MTPTARALALSALLSGAAPAWANPWAFVDPLLAQALGIQAGEGGAVLFPDHGDPAVAQVAIAFHYFGSRTGGNSFGLTVGLFRRQGRAWDYAAPVSGLFGREPRDVAFFPDRLEVTTTTLGPNDPRCCPTAQTRWAVDRSTGVATALP